MIQTAGLPAWAIILFIVMFAGQFRFLMGGRFKRRGSRWNRMAERHGLTGMDPAEVERLDAAISERDGVIEDLQRRLSEMESRLDFAERLITDKSQVAK